VNDPSVVHSEGGVGKKSRASAVLSPRELVRAALRRAWPGSPPNCPISRVQAAAPRTAYFNNYEVRESHAEILDR
jgi:hypothetical protein